MQLSSVILASLLYSIKFLFLLPEGPVMLHFDNISSPSCSLLSNPTCGLSVWELLVQVNFNIFEKQTNKKIHRISSKFLLPLSVAYFFSPFAFPLLKSLETYLEPKSHRQLNAVSAFYAAV